ncbi:hypothetical protein BDV24DRAFT_133122 [Aspergillus arachidicola]|uniref:Secreted protein n=1 Tax=Aspergillus arachidicola TaxID=656916 RepID=A0A5N6Y609_9EURO|nr:hypothetical protein BDV24DRAFT_133122 [Aspergillus arachidicola]
MLLLILVHFFGSPFFSRIIVASNQSLCLSLSGFPPGTRYVRSPYCNAYYAVHRDGSGSRSIDGLLSSSGIFHGLLFYFYFWPAQFLVLSHSLHAHNALSIS